MGLIWVLMTIVFKGKIKKLWLYTLFPVAIYSIPLVYLIFNNHNNYLLAAIIVVYIYFIYRFLKSFKFIDTILIPLLLIGLNILALLMTGA